MGLDGTIKAQNGEPLGDTEAVQAALADAFPGIVFGVLPSGIEKIKAAAEMGVVFPDAVREALESRPAMLGGAFECDLFSASFNLGTGSVVQQIDVMLYGATTAAEPMFNHLNQRFGWIVTHP